MSESILISTKKVLNLDEDYTAFDLDIIMHINSVISMLNQLGIGPEGGYEIVDDTATWDAFIGTNSKFNLVKTLIYLKVRMYFDPPTTSYLIEAMKNQIIELEWRLSSLREQYDWVTPEPTIPDDLILDGGSP